MCMNEIITDIVQSPNHTGGSLGEGISRIFKRQVINLAVRHCKEKKHRVH